MLRVVIIDNQRLFSDCLASRLQAETEFMVVGAAAECGDGLPLVLEHEPDVVILETDLSGRGSFAVAAEIIATLRNTRVVFLTNCFADVFLDEALRMQVAGFLLKSEPFELLLLHLRRIIDGEQRFSPAVRARLQYDERRHRFQTRSTNCLSSLTHQQLEVLRHLARGDSVKKVAHKVQQSERSVESQKYRIMQQLGIHDRVELTRFAIREGLTMP